MLASRPAMPAFTEDPDLVDEIAFLHLEAKVLGIGYWVLGAGCWVLGAGY